ncbi:hypothetical protein [Niveibacterium umoris]|uniref:Uncharacterized protein n=1 Tax=Niveibacterium umoris TaxID=1193620 RepID=A0A840BI97_9RHOO|nr:hypothetical protein [Niveibacterium umoris]MBB4012044.1 hypothetical protein [Niveibacterium umoris]
MGKQQLSDFERNEQIEAAERLARGLRMSLLASVRAGSEDWWGRWRGSDERKRWLLCYEARPNLDASDLQCLVGLFRDWCDLPGNAKDWQEQRRDSTVRLVYDWIAATDEVLAFPAFGYAALNEAHARTVARAKAQRLALKALRHPKALVSAQRHQRHRDDETLSLDAVRKAIEHSGLRRVLKPTGEVVQKPGIPTKVSVADEGLSLEDMLVTMSDEEFEAFLTGLPALP